MKMGIRALSILLLCFLSAPRPVFCDDAQPPATQHKGTESTDTTKAPPKEGGKDLEESSDSKPSEKKVTAEQFLADPGKITPDNLDALLDSASPEDLDKIGDRVAEELAKDPDSLDPQLVRAYGRFLASRAGDDSKPNARSLVNTDQILQAAAKSDPANRAIYQSGREKIDEKLRRRLAGKDDSATPDETDGDDYAIRRGGSKKPVKNSAPSRVSLFDAPGRTYVIAGVPNNRKDDPSGAVDNLRRSATALGIPVYNANDPESVRKAIKAIKDSVEPGTDFRVILAAHGADGGFTNFAGGNLNGSDFRDLANLGTGTCILTFCRFGAGDLTPAQRFAEESGFSRTILSTETVRNSSEYNPYLGYHLVTGLTSPGFLTLRHPPSTDSAEPTGPTRLETEVAEAPPPRPYFPPAPRLDSRPVSNDPVGPVIARLVGPPVTQQEVAPQVFETRTEPVVQVAAVNNNNQNNVVQNQNETVQDQPQGTRRAPASTGGGGGGGGGGGSSNGGGSSSGSGGASGFSFSSQGLTLTTAKDIGFVTAPLHSNPDVSYSAPPTGSNLLDVVHTWVKDSKPSSTTSR